MDRKLKNKSNGTMESDKGETTRLAKDLSRPVKLVTMVLTSVLVVVTDLWAGLLGSAVFRRHFHLLLSGVVLFGPALSLWVSKYSIFANRNHYLYRMFLRSGWGWTCVFTGSFIFLLSFSIRRSLALSLRHLSRIAAVGALWWGSRSLLTLLENMAGSCYEPMPATLDGGLNLGQGAGVPGKSLLLLHEGESKASCLKAGMLWRGWEVSEDALLLCLCCLLLAEETAVLGPYLALGGPSGPPLRLLFLLCVSLLGLWLFLLLCLLAYFPQFPSQLLGGALGCLGWRGMYQGWYRMQPSWCCPGWPGEGLLTTAQREPYSERGVHDVWPKD
ncbi:fat storage-inducing transmembrane protein 1 [Coregonus clupeaformis]|uniref:fat storage-inducing transmembrane protein 1 n=1 Tax=Coregonus clupeaformis TaxID=59861 RepID=UPI001BE0FF8F|nr:fat storage-inducing transmembrane protein 1 [Coregonus clupeaformis]